MMSTETDCEGIKLNPLSRTVVLVVRVGSDPLTVLRRDGPRVPWLVV